MLASIVGSPVSQTTAQQSASVQTAILEDWTTSGRWTLNGSGIRELENVADRELWEVYEAGNQGQTIAVTNNELVIQTNDGGTGTSDGFNDEGVYFQFYPKDPDYDYSGGYTQDKLVGGTWNPNFNELRFRMKCDQSHLSVTSTQRVGWHFGNYIRPHDGSGQGTGWQGAHYYNAFNMEVTADEWIWVNIHQQPHAQVSESGTTIYAYQSDFFDNLTRWYLDEWPESPWVGNNATWNFGPFIFQIQNDLPFVTQDSTQVLPVANVTVTHNGTGYDLGWQSQKYSTIVYSIYTHTSSIKEAGIGAATLLGTKNSLSNSPYTMLRYQTSALSKANRYFAIKPDATDEFNEIYYEVVS